MISMYIGVAAVLFVIGVLFIVRGISSEEQDAVPISNPKEIKDLKRLFGADEKIKSPDNERQIYGGVVSQKTEPREDEPQKNILLEENNRLRQEVQSRKEEFEQLKKDMESVKQAYAQTQEQKVQAHIEQAQMTENNRLLDELKVKTELLEKQYKESQKQQEDMRVIIGQLKTEKDDLLVQARLKDERAAEQLEQAAEQLRKQREEIRKTELETMNKKLVESISTLEDLKRENKVLQQENSDLKNEFSKVGELNKNLMKKEKMIQYELTKNRAQALGLEKICEDFRTQIETMAASEAVEV